MEAGKPEVHSLGLHPSTLFALLLCLPSETPTYPVSCDLFLKFVDEGPNCSRCSHQAAQCATISGIFSFSTHTLVPQSYSSVCY